MGHPIAFWRLLQYSVREKKAYAKFTPAVMQESFIEHERGVSDDRNEEKIET